MNYEISSQMLDWTNRQFSLISDYNNAAESDSNEVPAEAGIGRVPHSNMIMDAVSLTRDFFYHNINVMVAI